MVDEALMRGLTFLQKYALTPKEIEVLLRFFVRPCTAGELAVAFDVQLKSMHHTIQRLKMKRLLTKESRDSKGTLTYTLNSEELNQSE